MLSRSVGQRDDHSLAGHWRQKHWLLGFESIRRRLATQEPSGKQPGVSESRILRSKICRVPRLPTATSCRRRRETESPDGLLPSGRAITLRNSGSRISRSKIGCRRRQVAGVDGNRLRVLDLPPPNSSTEPANNGWHHRELIFSAALEHAPDCFENCSRYCQYSVPVTGSGIRTPAATNPPNNATCHPHR